MVQTAFLLFFRRFFIHMSQKDTINLLRECNSGIQMAVFSIDEILDKTEDEKLRKILTESKKKHEQLGDETHALLSDQGAGTEDANMLAKGMSWIKTNAKVLMDDSDKTIADLITDGCNMGIKTLYRYLNEYSDADSSAAKLASSVIRAEEALRQDLRDYL